MLQESPNLVQVIELEAEPDPPRLPPPPPVLDEVSEGFGWIAESQRNVEK